ncbi:MAG TPA: nicotinate-nucleotide--dimethylbenzimidazole phosphoribosyltransferase [Actinomycetota bacterium]
MTGPRDAEEAARAAAAGIQPPDHAAAAAALARHDRLTKPLGSLGVLEDLGVRLAAMAGRCPPPVPACPVLVVAAADHGVLVRGVSPWPAEVTSAMVGELCRGNAAANVLARVVGAGVTVLDAGVGTPLGPHPRLRRAGIRRGTADCSAGPAMTRDEASRAILAGVHVAEELAGPPDHGDETGPGADQGADLLVTGDMGIGNTTAAACLIAAFTGRPAAAVTGRGTGIDDEMLACKQRVVGEVLALHHPSPADPVGTLACIGGLEHAALTGVILGAAGLRLPVLLDGVSACAAALAAAALAPGSVGYMVAGHRSVEPGATAALEHLGLSPLLDLRMRLGEGTGALLAVPLVRSAAAVLAEMPTFEEAGLARAAGDAAKPR